MAWRHTSNVLIDYFWRPANIPFSAAEQLRSYVMEGITNTNRVELIDVDSQDALAIEASFPTPSRPSIPTTASSCSPKPLSMVASF